MSLDKAILHNKERRKPYKGAKFVDSTCRNHGSCSYCQSNRRIKEYRLKCKLRYDRKEWGM